MPNLIRASLNIRTRMQHYKHAYPHLAARMVALFSQLLDCEKTWLLAHDDEQLTTAQIDTLNNGIARCSAGEPLAYIIGHIQFCGLEFEVDAAVLIPREDSKTLVDTACVRCQSANAAVLDMGTGSGAIAAAIAACQPAWQVSACDISAAALVVARRNFAKHSLNIAIIRSDWFAAITARYNVIVANPPYIGYDDTQLQASVVAHEPHLALFAADNGLAALAHIIRAAKQYLHADGLLCLEHGFTQASAVQALLQEYGYVNIRSDCDPAGHQRVTSARYVG